MNNQLNKAGSLPVLRFLLPNGQQVDIATSPYQYIVLGRQKNDADQGVDVDVDLSTAGRLASSVSQTHAMIQVIDHQVFVRDYNSHNGTFLNGRELLSTQNYPLKDGDELMLGSMIITVKFLY